MKTIGSIFAVLLISVSTFCFASPKGGPNKTIGSEKIEIETKEQGLYNLVYKTSASGRYKVIIYDQSGRMLFSEMFISEKSFTKLFNLKNLPYGIYTMEITNSSLEKIKKEIIHKSPVTTNIVISNPDAQGKVNLVVTGVDNHPVRVVIWDQFNHAIYDEVMFEESDFSRLYNFKGLNSPKVTFQVYHHGKAIEKQIVLN